MTRPRPGHLLLVEIFLLHPIEELKLPGGAEIRPHGRVDQREQEPDGTQDHTRDGGAAFGIGVDAQYPEDKPGDGHRGAANGQQPCSQAEQTEYERCGGFP